MRPVIFCDNLLQEITRTIKQHELVYFAGPLKRFTNVKLEKSDTYSKTYN